MSLADSIESLALSPQAKKRACCVGEWLDRQDEKTRTAFKAYLEDEQRSLAQLLKLCTEEGGMKVSTTSFTRHCRQKTCACWATR